MNNKSKKNKFFTFLFFTIVCIFYLCESGSIESYAQNSFFGGDLVYYDLCIINNDSVSATFPIISSSPIKDISLEKITNDEISDSIDCKLEFNRSDSVEYKKHYINFFTVTFSSASEDLSSFSSDIKSLMLSIDDHSFEYKTPHLSLCNSEYLSEDGKYAVNTDSLTKADNDNSMLSSTPSSDNMVSHVYNLKDGAFFINLTASKFYNINDCNLDGKTTDPENIYSRIDNKDNFSISYSFDYKDKKCAGGITRSVLILKYQQDCKLKMFISNDDLYVYPDYSDNQIIKSYIDKELGYSN